MRSSRWENRTQIFFNSTFSHAVREDRPNPDLTHYTPSQSERVDPVAARTGEPILVVGHRAGRCGAIRHHAQRGRLGGAQNVSDGT
jgi:hypothetical protein